MKYKSLLIALLCLFALGAQAQRQWQLGYCNDNYVNSFSFEEKVLDTYVAMLIDGETAQAIKGNELVSISYFAPSNLGRTADVFVCEGTLSLTDNVTSEEVEPFVSGWNETELSEPYTITGEPFYICMHIYNPTAANQGSNHTIPYDNVAPEAGRFFIYKDGAWVDAVADCQMTGNVMMRGLVKGANLPGSNVALSMVDYKKVVGNADAVNFKYEIINKGGEDLRNFTLTHNFKGENEDVLVTLDKPLHNGEYTTLSFGDFTFAEVGQHTLNVTLSQPNGEADEDMSDNAFTGIINVFDSSKAFERYVLLEMFTTEHCPNCPNGHSVIEDAVAVLPEGEDRVLWVCHHAGYGEDEYTNADAKAYMWFYDGGTFAPAYMLDRTWIADTRVSYGDATGPVHGIKGIADVKHELQARIADSPYMDVHVAGEYNAEDNNVTLHIYGANIYEGPISDPRINVWILEDGIETRSQGGVSGKYIHNGVQRASLTGTWGQQLDLTDGYFNCDFSAQIPATVKDINNCWILAFVSNYDASDVNNCQVFNARRCNVKDIAPVPESIATVADESSNKVESTTIYAADGRVMSGYTKGLNIVQQTMANGQTKAVKVIR